MQNEKDTHKCTFFKKIFITMLNYPYICIQNVRQRMKLYGQSRGTPWQITYLYIYVARSYMGRAETRHGKKESLNRFRPTVINTVTDTHGIDHKHSQRFPKRQTGDFLQRSIRQPAHIRYAPVGRRHVFLGRRLCARLYILML